MCPPNYTIDCCQVGCVKHTQIGSVLLFSSYSSDQKSWYSRTFLYSTLNSTRMYHASNFSSTARIKSFIVLYWWRTLPDQTLPFFTTQHACPGGKDCQISYTVRECKDYRSFSTTPSEKRMTMSLCTNVAIRALAPKGIIS